jgi:hypothetical protein
MPHRRSVSGGQRDDAGGMLGIDAVRSYPSAYASAETLGYLLDLEPAAVRAYVCCPLRRSWAG